MKVRPSVALVANHQVLLMQYQYGDTLVYNLPGGNTDPSETLTETIIRELQEEINVTVLVENLLLCGEVILPQQKTDVLHCVFKGKIIANEPMLNPNETSALAIVWQPIDSLDTLPMYPNVGKALKEALTNGLENTYLGQIDQTWY